MNLRRDCTYYMKKRHNYSDFAHRMLDCTLEKWPPNNHGVWKYEKEPQTCSHLFNDEYL